MSSYSDQSSQPHTASAPGASHPTHPVMPVIDSNGAAIAGFCCAIFASLFAWIPIIGWVVSPIWFGGLLCSFIGLYKALFDGRKHSALASAGIMFSLVGTVLWWLGISVLFTGTEDDGSSAAPVEAVSAVDDVPVMPADQAGATDDADMFTDTFGMPADEPSMADDIPADLSAPPPPSYEDETSGASDDPISGADAALAAILGYAPTELSGHGDVIHDVIWPSGTVLEVSFTGDGPCADFEVAIFQAPMMAPEDPAASGKQVADHPYDIVSVFCVEDHTTTVQLMTDVDEVLVFADGSWSIAARLHSSDVTPGDVTPAGPADTRGPAEASDIDPPLMSDDVSPMELHDYGSGQYEVNWPKGTMLSVFFTWSDSALLDPSDGSSCGVFTMVLTYANGDVDQVVDESCVENHLDFFAVGTDVSSVEITANGLWWIDVERSDL